MSCCTSGLNGEYLRDILKDATGKTDNVKVAIAYASGNPELFQHCFVNNIKLTFWARYDETVPVTLPILKNFLDRRSPNYVCKLVPDIFHAKIIWWEGYGVYIGSANLTNKAWYNNIDAGLFLDDEEIIEKKIENELSNFFEEIDQRSAPPY